MDGGKQQKEKLPFDVCQGTSLSQAPLAPARSTAMPLLPANLPFLLALPLRV